MSHSNINPVIKACPRTKSQIGLLLLLSDHTYIPARNYLHHTHATISEFPITTPDFNERGVECKDIFPVDDLCGAWLAVPIYDFGAGDFAMFVDVYCAFYVRTKI
jgi:hypothetical protein